MWFFVGFESLIHRLIKTADTLDTILDLSRSGCGANLYVY
jgi:hypothetical protein